MEKDEKIFRQKEGFVRVQIQSTHQIMTAAKATAEAKLRANLS
jgi:hypothetical protein